MTIPVIDTEKIPTRLTNLKVNEVSLVSRGAIGETFSIMKSADELVEKVKGSDISSKIKSIPDPKFVSYMKQMMDNYQKINKNLGGLKMDENQIVSLMTDVIAKAMEPINSNFSKINKSMDGICKKVKEQGEAIDKVASPDQSEADDELNSHSSDGSVPPINNNKPAKGQVPAANAGTGVQAKPADSSAKISKAIEDIGKAVKDLAETVHKSISSISSMDDKVQKMAEEILPGIASRVESIEKQEQKPNGVDGVPGQVPITKSGSKWPSFGG